jgi:hypothetical protein
LKNLGADEKKRYFSSNPNIANIAGFGIFVNRKIGSRKFGRIFTFISPAHVFFVGDF